MQDKTGINGTGTDALGRDRNRDMTGIHGTVLGSQSRSQAAWRFSFFLINTAVL